MTSVFNDYQSIIIPSGGKSVMLSCISSAEHQISCCHIQKRSLTLCLEIFLSWPGNVRYWKVCLLNVLHFCIIWAINTCISQDGQEHQTEQGRGENIYPLNSVAECKRFGRFNILNYHSNHSIRVESEHIYELLWATEFGHGLPQTFTAHGVTGLS